MWKNNKKVEHGSSSSSNANTHTYSCQTNNIIITKDVTMLFVCLFVCLLRLVDFSPEIISFLSHGYTISPIPRQLLTVQT